ncbi:MAG: FkbM family methyltransferase [Parcubacteria group bacterium]|jgi:FkbM family methyltransferase
MINSILNFKRETSEFIHSQIHGENLTMRGGLKRCSQRGINPKTVIDIGASNGQWSKLCMETFPKADYLLVDAQDAHTDDLNKFVHKNKNAQFIVAAAGEKDGKIYFDNHAKFGGLASDTPFENGVEVHAISLDNEIKRRQLKGPYLLKLDTHGFEIPILEGAKEIIRSAELIILETYNFQITNDSLKYYQMCAYMEERGFSPIEIVDLMLRKHDKSFWQMDTFFIPSSSKEFKHRAYL